MDSKTTGSMVERTFSNGVLISDELPKVRIWINPMYAYMGCDTFILNGIASAEQYLFIQVDAYRRVKRLLWIQFEGYLNDNHHSYHYPPMEEIRLGSLAFLHDAGLNDIDQDYQERPQSDGSHVVNHLKTRGYLYEGVSIFERYVWLDSIKRNELMIIYSEDLQLSGFSTAGFQPGVIKLEAHPNLLKSLQVRALASFDIR